MFNRITYLSELLFLKKITGISFSLKAKVNRYTRKTILSKSLSTGKILNSDKL